MSFRTEMMKALKAKAPAKAKTAKTTSTKSSELEKKYPGGVWRTMRGHKIYIKGDGTIAKETLPKDKEAKARILEKQVGKKLDAGKKTAKKLQSTTKKAKEEAVKAKAKAEKANAKAKRAADQKAAMASPTKTTTRWTNDGKGNVKQVTTKAGNTITPKLDKPVSPASVAAQEAADHAIVASAADVKGKTKGGVSAKVRALMGDLLDDERAHEGTYHLPKVEKTEEGKTRFVRGKDGKVQFEALTGKISESEYIERMELLTRAYARSFLRKKGLDHIGAAAENQGVHKTQSSPNTGYFDDLAQEFRVGLMTGLREFTDAKAKGRDVSNFSPSQFAVGRAIHHMSRYGHALTETIRLPRSLRTPLAAYGDAVREAQEAHSTDAPTSAQVLEHLEGTAAWESFKPFVPGKKGEYITDPVAKLKVLELLNNRNRKVSLQNLISGGGNSDNKGISGQDVLRDENQDTEGTALAKQAQREANTALYELLNNAGVSDREMQVLQNQFGLRSGQSLTEEVNLNQVAEAMGLSHANVRKIASRAMAKLREYMAQNPDAAQHYRTFMKSFDRFGKMLMKSLFEADLFEMFETYGLGIDILEWTPTRQVITKSLDTLDLGAMEYVMSSIRVHGQGVYRVTVGEPVLPSDSLLMKALAASGDILSKSASGSEHRTYSAAERTGINQKVRTWANGKGRERIESHAKTQAEALANKEGPLTWSEQLLVDNPGSAWITWGGHKILIQGDGRILYDSKSGREGGGGGYNAERRKHVAVDDEGNEVEHDLHDGTDDYASEQKEAELDEKAKSKALQIDAEEMKRRFITHRDQFRETEDYQKMKDRMGKGVADRYLAPGKYMAEGPDGKRVVFEIKMAPAASKKDPNAMTPSLGDVWSVDDDEGRGVSKHESDYGVLLGLLYGVKDGQAAWNRVHNQPEGTSKRGLVLPETLEKWAYNDKYREKYGLGPAHTLTKLEDNEWDSVLSKTDNAASQVQARRVEQDLSKATKNVTPHDDGSHSYKINLPDGRTATFNVGKDGQLTDPVMKQLLNVDETGIRPGEDGLYDLEVAMAKSIGRKAWMTISPSSGVLGKNAHHHIQLEFTGIATPPRIVGGQWDGRLYADASDLTDPEQKKLALFRNGKLIEGNLKMSTYRKGQHETGDKMRFRAKGRSRYQTGTVEKIIKNNFTGEVLGYSVRVPGQAEPVKVTSDDFDVETKRTKDIIAGSLPVADWNKDHLVVTVPDALRNVFEDDLKIDVKNGKATLSLAQFAEIREAFGGFTLTDAASPIVNEYLEEQNRPPGFMTQEERKETYQPTAIIAAGGKKAEAFKKLLREDSVKLSSQPFYDTQLQGVHHLLTAKRGIAGHDMGTGKTQLGMLAVLHQLAEAHAAGVKPKKKLIVSPAAIVSDWLKEFRGHTNVGISVMGGENAGRVEIGEDGKRTGRRVMGTKGLEAPVIPYSAKNNNSVDFDSVDSDVIVVSNEFFSSNMELFNQGHFDTMMIDELHNLKNPSGSRGGALAGIAQGGHVKNIWGLSGTPMENDPTELWNLINMSTAGQHNLGSKDEFLNNFFERRAGKVIRTYPHKMEEMGKLLSKYVQFRQGEDVGVEFPEVTRPAGGYEPNTYHGSKIGVHSNYEEKYVKIDAKTGKSTETTADDPEAYRLFNPVLDQMGDQERQFYERYRAMEGQLLPENQLAQVRGEAASGYSSRRDDHKKGSGYLAGVNKLQQFMNAPDAWEALNRSGADIDVEDAVESKVTIRNGYHGVMDGNKFIPLHQNSPMGSWVAGRIRNHLNAQRTLNTNRAAQGQKPIPPKMVLSSQFTQLGTRVLENVVNELKQEYPELTHATYTGESGKERDQAAADFNLDTGVNIMIMSSAAKEGKDFGTSQMFISLDHEWNPKRTAQKVARTRRSDSKRKRAALAGVDPNSEEARELNKVSVESPFIPGTIHGDILNAHDRKVKNIDAVVGATRQAEGIVPNTPDASAGKVGATAGEHRRFGAKAREKTDPVTAARSRHDTLLRRAQELRTNAENTKTTTVPTRQGSRTYEQSDKMAAISRRNILREAAKLEAQASRLREKHGFSEGEGKVLPFPERGNREENMPIAKGFTFDYRPVTQRRMQHIVILKGR